MLFCVVFDFYRRILVGAVIFDILSAWGSFGRVLRRALSRPSDVGYTHARSGSFGSGSRPHFIISRTRHPHSHKPCTPYPHSSAAKIYAHAAPALNRFKAQIGTKLNLHLRRTQSSARRVRTSFGGLNLRSHRATALKFASISEKRKFAPN